MEGWPPTQEKIARCILCIPRSISDEKCTEAVAGFSEQLGGEGSQQALSPGSVAAAMVEPSTTLQELGCARVDGVETILRLR
jgi:hypothetical protein